MSELMNAKVQMFRNMGMVAWPYTVFFKPNQKFLETLGQWDNFLVEIGCGVGNTLMHIQNYGIVNGNKAMQNAVGCDIFLREKYDAEVIVGMDATSLDFNPYTRNQTILVCRPDHGAWVQQALVLFKSGVEHCKRFVYVSKPENIDIHFDSVDLGCVTERIEGVGEDGEVMLIWEIN